MDWVKNFYQKQNEWLPVYRGEITDFHRKNTQKILEHTRGSGKSLLELGSGGGQNAASAAAAGFQVTALEIVPELCESARRFCRRDLPGSLEIIETDFYQYRPEKNFDIITYWDGFGTGSDQDQQLLLELAASWLNPGGFILLEVYTPWYWASQAGKKYNLKGVWREYGFDAKGCRLLDTWYPEGHQLQAVTQSLRCYSPADLALLLKSRLVISKIESGGAIDEESGKYLEEVPLEKAMQYLARLEKNTTHKYYPGPN